MDYYTLLHANIMIHVLFWSILLIFYTYFIDFIGQKNIYLLYLMYCIIYLVLLICMGKYENILSFHVLLILIFSSWKIFQKM